MNQKEINELRRRFRPEKSTISRVYGCYVNSSKEIVSDLDESLGKMPQEETEPNLFAIFVFMPLGTPRTPPLPASAPTIPAT